MSAPRFESHNEIEDLGFRFQRTRLHRSHGITFRQFIEAPDVYEKMHATRMEVYRRNPLVVATHVASKPINLN